MTGTKLAPEKITSPFQLMAAWFSMLVLLVSVLLVGATKIEHPDWAAGYLVVFASIVILLVLACVTLMLTKFRPHLQEGKEYAEWLKDKGVYSHGIMRVTEVATEFKEVLVDSQNNSEAIGIKDLKSYSKDGFLISVADLPGSTNIIEGLKNKGFNVELFKDQIEMNRNLGEQSSIWVGERLPPAIALEAIKIALRVWPNLKYLQLSGDGARPPDFVHDQLFLGGSTSTALSRNLKAWTNEELQSLNAEMSIEDFHSVLRGKF